MKCLLISPPFEIPSKLQQYSYPLSLCYLGSVLEREGHKCLAYEFLFESWEKIKPKIEKIIKEGKFDIVLISSMTTNRTSGIELARLAKSINKNILVIMGGVHPTLMYSQILEKYPVDFIVIGEAEDTIRELIWSINQEPKLWKKLKALRENQHNPFKLIKGIAYKSNYKIIKTEPRPLIKDLDSIPFPKHVYFSDKIKQSKTAFMMTSRGCPFSCLFCNTSCYWGRVRRQRSVGNVIKEIICLKKLFPDLSQIYFNDDEFMINPAWVTEFSEALLKLNFKIEWECVGRVTSITEELVQIMQKAGCVKIDFGVESGSPKILEYIQKKITREQVINAYKICKKYNMPSSMYLMVGLPGETSETINETISLLKECKNAEFGIPALYQVFPGNQIYELAKSQGFIDDSYWLTDKPAPYYTAEHSKRKLTWWALKITLFHKLYRGELWSFLFNYIKRLRYDKLKKIVKAYIK